MPILGILDYTIGNWHHKKQKKSIFGLKIYLFALTQKLFEKQSWN